MKTESHSLEHLDLDADAALFQSRVRGVVAVCFQNERPLQGLAGLLDWRFQGLLSRYIRQGAASGRLGECVYLPVTRNEHLYHLLLVGGGSAPSPGVRPALGEEALAPLRKNLLSLRLDRVAVSRADLGGGDDSWFSRSLKGVPFCLVP
ncbi:MAG: hypothetical protein IT285_02185 [Bdellovibrionales bacterium]|nr:hypothetical protein [Bdellovibrionales bacterium]